MRHRLYALTTALHSKTALLQDLPSNRLVSVGQIHHDAVVMTTRIARSPGGAAKIRSLPFLRSWSYLLSVSSLRQNMDMLEDAVGDLLGVYEDDQVFRRDA